MYNEEEILLEMFGDIPENDHICGSKGFYLGTFSKKDYYKLKAIADKFEPDAKQFKFRTWCRIAIKYFIKCEYDGLKPKKKI